MTSQPGAYLPNGGSAKTALNKSLLDAGLGTFKTQLAYKARWYGSKATAVNPAYTSQMCNECKHTSKENRETQAVFKCIQCGHKANADINAAKNIRDKATSITPTENQSQGTVIEGVVGNSKTLAVELSTEEASPVLLG